MCFIFLKAQNMEEEVDKTLERTRKNEYYNILKLLCFYGLIVELENCKNIWKRRAKDNMHTQINK
jgi:hypothetical protein